jgi:hypothetical protein
MNIFNMNEQPSPEAASPYIFINNSHAYMLDFDRIIEYCSQSSNEKSNETTLTEIYQNSNKNEMSLVQKQIEEHKTSGGTLKGTDNLRYDFFRLIFESFLSLGVHPMENGKVGKSLEMINYDGNISISEGIIWNTMLLMGFLKKIN